MTGSHPAIDQQRIRGNAVSVNSSVQRLVEDDVYIGARHMIDPGVDTADFAS